MKKSINRRTFKLSRRSLLRSGQAGIATVAGLPLLEAMFGSDAAFAQAPWETPRIFVMYVPNGIIEEKWYPQNASKTNFNLSGTALEGFQKRGLKNDISLYRGLTNACGLEGSKGNQHMLAISSWLTGTSIKNDAQQKHRPSLDQELADFLPRAKVHSLQLAGNSELDKPNNNRYFNPLKNALNWAKNGRLLPLKSDLSLEFDKLYSSENAVPGQGIDRRTQMKISVLDDVKDDRINLRSRLGASDAQRLDEYFESLRDVELQLEAAVQNAGPETCEVPVARDSLPKTPNGKRTLAIGDHMKISAKITANAFACGLTHAITYCAGGEAAGCEYRDIGINSHFHNAVSHSRKARYNDWLKIDKFHGDHCALFMETMKNTAFGPGNLLDNAAIVFGSGLGNGEQHSYKKISMLVGGAFRQLAAWSLS